MIYRTKNPNTRSNRNVPSYPRKRVSRLIGAANNLDSRVRGNDESREKRAGGRSFIFILCGRAQDHESLRGEIFVSTFLVAALPRWASAVKFSPDRDNHHSRCTNGEESATPLASPCLYPLRYAASITPRARRVYGTNTSCGSHRRQ
jgi:hypothetical protein